MQETVVGERPVGPVPLRRCRVGLDGLVATHLAVGGEVVVAALPAVIPCAAGATLVSIYGGVSLLGMIGVDHLAVMRCPPASDCRRRAACPGPAVSVELSPSPRPIAVKISRPEACCMSASLPHGRLLLAG